MRTGIERATRRLALPGWIRSFTIWSTGPRKGGPLIRSSTRRTTQRQSQLAPGTTALLHFVTTGVSEGRDPHPLFQTKAYLDHNADVALAGVNPLTHYYVQGGFEGRNPHPLFDSAFYLAQNPDVAAAKMNPLVHYLSSGAREGRDPHPLFQTRPYLEQHADVALAGVNPLTHYYVQGGFEGRDPHPLFDSAFYLAQNPDVAAAKINPLAHYLSSGAREGRDPHPDFDSSFYLTSNPDVVAANMNPLVHFVLIGQREGRLAHAPSTESPVARLYVPPQGLLPWFNPLNVAVSAPLSNEPRLNVLVPALGMRSLSGGPNTALVLAGRLAAAGIRVRLVATDHPLDQDSAPFWAHVRHLLGGDVPPGLELVDAHRRDTPWAIGERDIFLATAWWTAQQAKYAARHTAHQRFIYLIQDYEPLFHAASTPQALAEETYTLDHIPVINSPWLYDFLVARRVGRFADEQFARNALVFQPAVDRTGLPPASASGRQRTSSDSVLCEADGRVAQLVRAWRGGAPEGRGRWSPES